jgi:hypothetical protein
MGMSTVCRLEPDGSNLYREAESVPLLVTTTVTWRCNACEVILPTQAQSRVTFDILHCLL